MRWTRCDEYLQASSSFGVGLVPERFVLMRISEPVATFVLAVISRCQLTRPLGSFAIW